MSKKILQDVLPPGTRSIRRIPIERESTIKKTIRKVPETVVHVPKVVKVLKAPETSRSKKVSPVLDDDVVRGGGRKKNYPRMVLWGLAVFSIVFLALALAIYFTTASVEVVPKSEVVSVDATFTAKKNPLFGELGYSLMTLNKEAEESVSGTAGKKIEKRAIGNIILYNNFNSYSRKFLADTRLIAGNGKIYKLQSTVTIPGRTKVNGKFVPGSVQARVYAEKPGAEYNLLLKDLLGDFKVVAFAGDPQYETFYGRQKTDIAGGIISTAFTVSDSVAQSTRAKLRVKLKEQVTREALAQKPADFVLYHDDLSFVFESLPSVSKATSTVLIIERITFNGLLFKKELLANNIAGSVSKTLKDIVVGAQSLDGFVFGLKNKKETVSSSTNQFLFTLKGTTTLVAKIYPEKIQKDLMGKRTNEFQSVITAHKEIQEGNLQMHPFWSFAFPNVPEKITVVKKTPF